MPYTEPRSCRERAERLLLVAEDLLSLKNRLACSDADARGVALSNCRLAILNSVTHLNILAIREENRISDDHFRTLIGLATGPTQLMLEAIEKFSRLSLVLFFQFQVESLFTNLLRELGVSPSVRSYWHTLKAVVEATLGEAAMRDREILNTPALIRNSLHSNGIHNGRSVTVEIDGVVFEFSNGEKVSCAGWGHIAHALGASLESLERILLAPKVRELPDPIREQYYWETNVEEALPEAT